LSDIKSTEEVNSIITNIIKVSPMMRIIRVKPDGWQLPEYKSGQFVAIGLPPEIERYALATKEYKETKPGKMIRRAYSIASSSTQDYVEFYITVVHSGSLTPRIFSLEIGDKIWMGKKATGIFTLDEVDDEKNIILIATGTGIAPYMSMLRANALHRKGKIMIIHGASNSWDLGYQSELELLDVMMPNFTYYPTITNPDLEAAKWNGDTRFIEEIWEDSTVSDKMGIKPTSENSHIFLCGNPFMIDSMIEKTGELGFYERNKRNKRNPEEKLHFEKF
jgi:ferredoxin--NADP+ reductase